MREEKLKFHSGELELVGILTNPEIPLGKTIVLCHGISVDKDESGFFTKIANRLAEVGYHVFRFDFRGHGESQGNSVKLTVAGEVEDISAAINFLVKNDHNIFGILALSFGAGPTLLYSSENQNKIKAIALVYPLIDYECILDPKLPWPKETFGPDRIQFLNEKGYLPVGSTKFRIGKDLIEEIISLQPYKKLEGFDIPVLFIHGTKDTYVPFEHSEKYSKWPKKGKFLPMEGADHGFFAEKPELEETAIAEVIRFFKEHI